jgi:hypothetical protein
MAGVDEPPSANKARRAGLTLANNAGSPDERRNLAAVHADICPPCGFGVIPPCGVRGGVEGAVSLGIVEAWISSDRLQTEVGHIYLFSIN